MKTVRRACPVCGSEGEREVLHRQRFLEGPLGEGYAVVVCAECGAGFADDIPEQSDLDHYYEQRSKYTYAHSRGVESPYDFKRFEIIADQLESYLPDKNSRILDIGCATGGLLAVLKRRGYVNVVGSDPSPACAVAARKLHGLEVRTFTLAQHMAWTDRFDAVLLVGVLEHLHEARVAVQAAAGLLSPEGCLYCAQPDVEAFAACANAPYQQFSTEHVNFFSAFSLNNLMTTTGLAVSARWHWMVEWRQGVTDSVLSAVFVHGPPVFSPDRVTASALRLYLKQCAAEEEATAEALAELVRTGEAIFVWGAGTLTRRLLATTSLARANIVAFVDSSTALQGTRLGGRAVLAPSDVTDGATPIVICSRVFDAEIRQIIQEQLRLSNPVRSLLPSGSAAK